MAGLGSDPAFQNYVPQYDIYGHRHISKPYKDKTDIFQKEIRHPKWLEPPPAIKTRTELQQARKQSRIPHKSYDFDGDGVVGQLDYFVGKCFDGDADGRLTTGERRQAEKALNNGFLDKYVRGLDATGDVPRGCFVRQRRGIVTAADNTQEISSKTYQPHFNAHKVPEISTQTALALSRLSEAKGAGLVNGERWAAVCAPIIEPQPSNHITAPRTNPISHIGQRAEGDHQLARVRGGLLPMSTAVNPEREYKTVGIERVNKPLFATRGQLMETRKEAMKRESEDLRAKGDEVCVPLSVRKAERDSTEFEFRRPIQDPMTLTRLRDSRRRDKIEYDMQHFGFQQVAPREYPKFSDHPDIPFWVSDPANGGAPGRHPPAAIPRTLSEPVFKITEMAFRDEARETTEALPEQAQSLAAGRQAHEKPVYGSKTVKRWSADMLERGQGRNQPRLFDNIQPVRIGPKDLESLDLTSSLEPVRSAALRARTNERKSNAQNPRRSQLWSDPMESSRVPNGSIFATRPQGSKEAYSLESASAMLRSASNPSFSTSPGVSRPLATAVMSSDAIIRAPPPGPMPDMTKPQEPRFYGGATGP
ncbi:unnamed protein product, partial [Polarella glacialis]